MSTFAKFEEIEAWQIARRLNFEIYAASKKSPFAKDFDLRRQIRDASVSIMANVAEGFERSGSGEFQQFLAIAKGSLGEVISHLYIALDQGYITPRSSAAWKKWRAIRAVRSGSNDLSAPLRFPRSEVQDFHSEAEVMVTGSNLTRDPRQGTID